MRYCTTVQILSDTKKCLWWDGGSKRDGGSTLKLSFNEDRRSPGRNSICPEAIVLMRRLSHSQFFVRLLLWPHVSVELRRSHLEVLVIQISATSKFCGLISCLVGTAPPIESAATYLGYQGRWLPRESQCNRNIWAVCSLAEQLARSKAEPRAFLDLAVRCVIS
jgi:hypothetical protein